MVLWERAEHTAAKHAILRRYLGGWFPKLAWNKRLVYIDGFAGPGEYIGGHIGSPLIALDVALHHRRDLSELQLEFLFIEDDQPSYDHLQALVATRDIPSNINVEVVNAPFQSSMDSVFDRLGSARMAPSLVLIDPFGVKGVPYSVLTRLARYPKSEVIVSFMYESMNRWITTPEFEPHLEALFGDTGWTSATAMSPRDRKNYLLNLYIGKLKTAGWQHVRAFEMRDSQNKTEYYLVFATHNREGLSLMKEAMWKVDPAGGVLLLGLH